MAFTFHNLDEETRQRMLLEVDRDVERGVLYESVRLTALGASQWEEFVPCGV